MLNKKIKKYTITISITLILLIINVSTLNASLIENNKQQLSYENTFFDSYTDITVQEAWDMLNDSSNGIQIPIDVRTDGEWADEHIDTPHPENPQHHCVCEWDNMTILQEFMSEYEGQEIIVYCRTGVRSVNAINMLIDNGFIGTIYNMLGGITDWKANDYPTIANQPPNTPDIIGPTEGKAGENQEYRILSRDPESDTLFYNINWSDGTNITTIGPYESNEEVIINHIWEEKGTYILVITATDYYGDESGKATLEISIAKTKEFNILEKLMEFYTYFFNILKSILEAS